jgi:enamine deaminase RidA (YjgF/YER057c/UK114 family)
MRGVQFSERVPNMKRVGMIAVLLLLSISLQAADADRKYVKNPRPTALQHVPFSDAVLVGDTLYLAGHIGIDPKTGKPGATADEEAKLLLDAVKKTLEAGGMTMDDLVQVEIYCSDVSLYQQFNDAYRTYFHGDFPARAFIGSGKLLFGARWEMMGIAVKKK